MSHIKQLSYKVIAKQRISPILPERMEPRLQNKMKQDVRVKRFASVIF